MDIRLFNSLSRSLEVFRPLDPQRVTFYVCGPTVYNYVHIGNARGPVVFGILADLLRRHFGGLAYARNITDVDDKINAAALEQGVPISAITDRFAAAYREDMAALGVAPPDLEPAATAHIPQMIGMIESLIERGHAYAAEGHALFAVDSFPEYGQLSRRSTDEMLAGARVEVAPYKRAPGDFVLWKPSPPELPGWDSPWGRGRPGWHIECSAMIEAHLGQTIDIHGGGLDLIFPHHENEIAQSRCAHGGAPLARYWLHNGFLSMAGSEKMSKSLGNVVTVAELLEQGHKGETLRLALLSAHYRQPLEWSEALIAQSKATLDRWYRVLEQVQSLGLSEAGSPSQGVLDALADDLNTPLALSELSQGFARSMRAAAMILTDPFGGAITAARFMGFLQSTPAEWFQGESDSRIDQLVTARTEAKKRRDFAEADRIRAELAGEGVLLEDGPQGTTWRRA
jgi:cysteinyl-tRNA synthetase